MLGTYLSLFGWLAILGAIAITVLRCIKVHKLDEYERRRLREQGEPVPPKEPILKTNLFVPIGLACAGLCLALFQSATFYSERGFHYFVQYPTGSQHVFVDKPGYHMSWFGTVDQWKSSMSVVHTSEHQEQGDGSGKVSSANPPIAVRFNDSVTADVESSVRFTLPKDPDSFKRLVKEYRTQANLINATLNNYVKEVIQNTARLYSAQEYVTGKGGDFLASADDQMRMGTYLLDVSETSIRNEAESVTEEGDRVIQGSDNRVQLVVKPRLGEDGIALRKPSVLKDFNVIVAQVIIADVTPETRFKEMLGLQRDAAAQASIKRQEAKTLGLEALRINAEGEAEKAKIRNEQEKEQIKIVVAAETEAKRAEQEQKQKVTEAETLKKVEDENLAREMVLLDQEKVKTERSKVKAEGIKALADAEAYSRRQIMEADNALKIRLDNQLAINKAWAEAIGDKQLVPGVVIGGGGEGGDSSAMALIQLLQAKLATDVEANLKKAE